MRRLPLQSGVYETGDWWGRSLDLGRQVVLTTSPTQGRSRRKGEHAVQIVVGLPEKDRQESGAGLDIVVLSLDRALMR